VTNTIQGYLQHADECERLAQNSRSEEERQQILAMAETWRMLARRRKESLRKDDGDGG
jgi:hypothetical protein